VVFMLLLFVSIMVGGAAFLWQSGVNTAALQKDSLRAFYIAQAGIERGRAEIAFNSTTNPNMQTYQPSFLNNTAFGGSYDLIITSIAADTKEILSRGRFNNSTREINMTITRDAGGGASPPYGNAWGYWARHQDTWIEQ